MKNRTKKITALMLAICLAVPATIFNGFGKETKAADTATDAITSSAETGDTNVDGSVDVIDLVKIKKNTSSDTASAVGEEFDLNNDGNCDVVDSDLMRQFLVEKISSFYRPDTSSVNNDTHVYTVTDELDREIAGISTGKEGKTVGLRYFLNDSLDKSAIERDVQMLTDAGVDFLAVDISDDTLNTEKLTLLMNTLDKYAKQGFAVPKVTFAGSAENENTYTSIDIGLLTLNTSDGPMNLITKDTYKGGSTVSFRAYVPKGASWLAVSWTTDSNTAGIYKWASDEGANGKQVTDVEEGKWKEYTVTLPEDENDYYIYIVGNGPDWATAGTAPLLLDDIVITSGDTSVKEDSETAMSDWIFNTVATTSKGKTVISTVKESTNHNDTLATFYNNSAYSDLWYQDDAGIVKYIGTGSMRTVRAARESISHNRDYNGMSHVGDTTYLHGYNFAWEFDIAIEDDVDTILIESWNEHETIADADIGKTSDLQPLVATYGDNYYMQLTDYIAQWKGNTITNENLNTVAEKKSHIIDIEKTFTQWNKVNTHYLDYTEETEAGVNDIAKMKMTSDSTYLYALVETADAITGWGEANRMSLFISTKNVGGCWNQYEYVVNRDSSQAADGKLVVEQYAGGTWTNVGSAEYRLEGNKLMMAIPLSVLGCEDVSTLEFKWADSYSVENINSFYTSGDVAPYGRLNYVYTCEGRGNYASVNVAYLTHSGNTNTMNLITDNTYPGGSTVTFEAYLPSNASGWWAIGYTSNQSDISLYAPNSGTGNFASGSYTTGAWDTYTVTLPEGEEEYYIYIAGPQLDDTWYTDSTKTASKALLVDNFKITKDSDVLAMDTFDDGLYGGIFNGTETGVSGNIAVSLQTTQTSDESTSSDNYAKINMKNINATAGQMSFITKAAYPGGSTVTFKAKTDSELKTWWNVGYATSKGSIGIYTGTSGTTPSYTYYGETVNSNVGEWVDISLTLPTEQSSYYLAIKGNQPDFAGNDADANVFIDDFRVTDASGNLIAKDDFSEGFDNGLFDVTELNGDKTAVELITADAEQAVDNVVAITPKNYGDGTGNYFITKGAYEAGTTITFKAYLPNTKEGSGDWWSVCWTTDSSSTSVYAVDSETNKTKGGVRRSNDNCNSWLTITMTLPADISSNAYIYIGPRASGWLDSDGNALSILIDDVRIIDKNGEILASDNFNYDAISDGLFNSNKETAVSLKSTLELDDAQKKNNGIIFTAYSAPTINKEVGADNADEEAALLAKLDDAYAKLAEAGFGKAIAMHEGESKVNITGNSTLETIKLRSDVTEELAMNVLDIAQKHGVKYYVKDWSFYNLVRNYNEVTTKNEEWFNKVIAQIFSADNPYIKHAAYAGNFGFDEPNVKEMESIAWQAKLYNKYMKQNGTTGGDMLVNLLPSYANQEQLFADANSEQSYEDYVDYYFENIAAELGYVCWDFYPLKTDNTIRSRYLRDLELMAERSKNATSDVELRTFVQAIGSDSNGMRTLQDIGDLRFQIYSGMAFGVREFLYYTYSGSSGSTVFNCTDQTYNEDLYNWAKTVHSEVHGMEDVYSHYQWDGIMYKNADESNPNASFEKLENPVTTGTVMEITSCTQDTLAGIFKAKDTGNSQQDAIMLVNYANTVDKLSDTVTVKFPDTKLVTVYRAGKETTVALNSEGTCTFTLNPGEGIFIVPAQ